MNSEAIQVQLPDDQPVRVDRFIASLGMFTRSQISQRSVRVRDSSGQELKLSKRLKEGDVITVDWDDPPAADIEPESMDLDIVYDGPECMVINKPQGMVVHPAHGNLSGTLVQGLLYRYREMERSFGGDRVRPGVVHRLDKDTSGLIVAAKNPKALNFLAAQFRNRTVKKTYLGITRGVPREAEGLIDNPIGRDLQDRKKFTVDVRNAKPAMTRYWVLAQSSGQALVRIRIFTGRTHQIRVHMKSMGCPILGDPIYTRPDRLFPQATLMLHSWKLHLEIPGVGFQSFTAPIPERFLRVFHRLEIDEGLVMPSS